MATFVTLANFTDQGVRGIKDTTKRADTFREQAKSAGLTIREIFWTMGQYDLVVITETQDERTAAAALMKLAAQGNVRTQTLPAFSKDEINAMLGVR
jgi:uncharacterized protein with GYD domain